MPPREYVVTKALLDIAALAGAVAWESDYELTKKLLREVRDGAAWVLDNLEDNE